MKLKKKTAMAISFALGVFMFSATAMAEVTSKNGYTQLKDAIKYTAKSCTETLPNYTLSISSVIKDGGKVLSSDDSLNKYDLKNQAKESTDSRFNGSIKRNSYFYRDKDGYITNNNPNQSYYVYTEKLNTPLVENPFDDERASDLEKIADAIVGNLKNSVVVTKNSDGSKKLHGSISNTQIPSVINAFVSFQLKGMANNEKSFPKLVDKIYLKNIQGSADIDKNGLIKNALLSCTITGEDKNGTSHTLTMELMCKIYNINSTSVKRPDLSDKKVIKETVSNYNEISNPEQYIGKYKSDILTKKDNKFVKIGQRIVTIDKLTKTKISGNYYEEYKKGYESYAKDATNFKFNGELGYDNDNFAAKVTSVTSSDKNSHKLYLNINPEKPILYIRPDEDTEQINDNYWDGSFYMVFD
ncbi:hypothetical protein H2684_06975 [Clostridium sp. cel8]|jgi:hypothetical protein|uniref:hypothetical protein n=1 Tax=Clostridium sp. cel8 TaxID=2663123 RepID=UPI0015F60553|nr:hypothetical protein [Clostridium sp. cel8]MBA5851048.1 hypothetical protein [Clostridium sp. cel8]